MKNKVLIVDDEQTIRNSLKRLIEKNGYEPIVSACGKDAVEQCKTFIPDIVFLDYRLPDMNGLDTMKKIKEITPEVVIFFVSAYGTIKTVVKAIQLGAFDYIQKPYKNEEILVALLKAKEHIKLCKEVMHLRFRNQASNLCNMRIIAESKEIRRVIEMAKNVAKSPDTPILIQGETGVGKEGIAHTIHYNSPRSEGPFLKINCAAIPKDLIESELFGHEKGAFTGADNRKLGFFELSEGGTLLMDEIGELDMRAQVKLMRILENKTFFKVGGTSEQRSDTRIIASTNRILAEEVKKGTFREDLYYRLNVIIINVPSLKMRRSDIIPLAQYFMKMFNLKFNKKINKISTAAEHSLVNHEWRGNVRELKNVMERVVLLSDKNTITPEMLSIDDKNSKLDTIVTINLSQSGISIDEVKKLLMQKALQMTKGNQVKAANLLGMSRGSFRHGSIKYSLNNQDFKP